MSRDKMYYGAAILAAAVMGVLGGSAMATPWTFGVMSDTQWSGADPTGNNINTVAVNQAKAVNQQFVAAGVKFVVQVGDLCDSNGTNNAALQTRLDANSALDAAGIPFYGLRGNHESSTGSQTFFQNNYIPAGATRAPDNTSYSVTYDNTKIVLLDITTAGNVANLDTQTTWMGTQLAAADHTQAFVFQHKNLLGQNHKDNEFGSSNDANPTQQNNFISAMQDNGVRYNLSGHDHLHHRSVVTSPDGNSSVQEIIAGSDSYKYYTPGGAFSSRETPVAQQLAKTTYYTFTVDGPRVTGKYFWTTPQASGDIQANPVWTLGETFGYSLNGKEVQIARGASYTAIADDTALAVTRGETGYLGTSMMILSGTNGSTAATYDGRATAKLVDTGWTSITEAGSPLLKSDVLSLWGMNDMVTVEGGVASSDTFTLSVSYDATFDPASFGSSFGLRTKDANGNWVLAGTSFAGDRAWSGSDTLGAYGYNSADHTVWAVVNHNSDFAAAVPEPASLALMGVSALILGRGRRNA